MLPLPFLLLSLPLALSGMEGEGSLSQVWGIARRRTQGRQRLTFLLLVLLLLLLLLLLRIGIRLVALGLPVCCA